MAQISDLAPPNRYITTLDDSGKAVYHQTASGLSWKSLRDDQVAFSLIYSTSQSPPSLARNEDLKAHDDIDSKGPGLVNPNGSIFRYVDFAPGYIGIWHQTKSLDYGIILEGQLDMELDSGQVATLKRGDALVQRATLHCWRNRSSTDWARVVFILQDCVAPQAEEKLAAGFEHLRARSD